MLCFTSFTIEVREQRDQEVWANGVRYWRTRWLYPDVGSSHLRPKELAMANLPLAFAEVVAGGVILLAGISGESIGDIIRGQFTIQPLTGGTAANASTTSSVGSINSGTTSTSGIPSDVVSEVNSLAQSQGWGQNEIDAWLTLISHESGGSTTATNPSTGAYGIGQFYAGQGNNVQANQQKYYTYGGNPGSVSGQLTGMMNYIIATYGTPSAAWAQYYNHPNGVGSY